MISNACLFLYPESGDFMDYIERLTACGMAPDDAWFLVDDFLSDGDRDGLISYIEELEHPCSPDVVEEVLSQIGLERIQPQSR